MNLTETPAVVLLLLFVDLHVVEENGGGHNDYLHHVIIESVATFRVGEIITIGRVFACVLIRQLLHLVVAEPSFVAETDARKFAPSKYLEAGVETITQFCTRMSYHDRFLYDPKKTMSHATEILEDGIGYNAEVQRFRKALKKHGFTDEAAFDYFNNKITMTYYEDVNMTIEDFFAQKVSRAEARTIVKKILSPTKGDVSS